MGTRRRGILRPAAAAALLLAGLAACGGDGERATPAKAWNDPGAVSRGDWTLYYNALRATELAEPMAKAYGVRPRRDGVLVSVSLVKAGDPRPAVDADVTMRARTLIGQARPVQVKRVERDGIVSWLGELDSAGRETLVFSVSAQLPGDPAPLVADFTRELHGAD